MDDSEQADIRTPGSSDPTAQTPAAKSAPRAPLPLAVDIGATGLKASVLDADGAMVADRVKVPTSYPMPPDRLVTVLAKLVGPLPRAQRASVGFPGMVRGGMVLSASHLATGSGPGSPPEPGLVRLWSTAGTRCPLR